MFNKDTPRDKDPKEQTIQTDGTGTFKSLKQTPRDSVKNTPRDKLQDTPKVSIKQKTPRDVKNQKNNESNRYSNLGMGMGVAM